MSNYIKLLRSTIADFKKACHEANVDEYSALSFILIESRELLKDVGDFASLEGLVDMGKTGVLEVSTRAHATLQHDGSEHHVSLLALANWLVEEQIDLLRDNPSVLPWVPLCRRSRARETLSAGQAVTMAVYPDVYTQLRERARNHKQSIIAFTRDALAIYTVQDIVALTLMDGFEEYHQAHQADGTRAIRLDTARAAMLRIAKEQAGVSSCAILSYIVDRALAAEKINLFIAVADDTQAS
jgi:hypothetical protein